MTDRVLESSHSTCEGDRTKEVICENSDRMEYLSLDGVIQALGHHLRRPGYLGAAATVAGPR
jgi:hypothetical protein